MQVDEEFTHTLRKSRETRCSPGEAATSIARTVSLQMAKARFCTDGVSLKIELVEPTVCMP